MATPKLDLNNLSPKQQAMLSRAMARLLQEEQDRSLQPVEQDYSKEPVVMVSHAADPIAYRVEGDALVAADGTRYDSKQHAGFTRCPQTGARIGYAPVAYNGHVIASLDDHVGLRKGDSAVLAQYQTAHEDEEVA